MKELCCLTLQQQHVTKDRTKRRQYATELISLLDFNVGIVAERGLQLYGFLHLSFEEYFVAQSFIRGSSIEEIARRILTFIINPRFRESLLLAIGLISWKWPFDDYNHFCTLLITLSTNYAIPFGLILLFDAFNDMRRLPSNSIIFTALNNLLNHPSRIFGATYLLKVLSQLSENIIKEWMQLYMKNDQCLLKFCQYFLMNRKKEYDTIRDVHKLSSVIYQQLWSFHHISTSANFVIDQTLRRIILSDDITEQIFNKELFICLSSDDSCVFDIHPSILSVIIAVCGGIRFELKRRITKIYFSSKQMHRKSSMLVPIGEYFDNTKDTHLIKIQTLIDHCHNVLENSSPSDISLDIVDTFIALICLQSISDPSIYRKYEEYKALPLALDRFKWIWFYSKESGEQFRLNDINSDMFFILIEFIPIMNVIFSQPDQSDNRYRSFSFAYAAACKKLRLLNSINTVNLNSSLDNNVDEFFQCHLEFIEFISESKLDLIAENINSLQILQKNPRFLLEFLPKSLQNLYYYTVIAPSNKIDSLPVVVLLSQCFMHLEDINTNDLTSCLALPILQPFFKEHLLENYGLVLFQENYCKFSTKLYSDQYKEFFKAMKDTKLLDQFLLDPSNDWKTLINVERQRIYGIKETVAIQNQEKDMRLFAASISLARLFQAQYRSDKSQVDLSNYLSAFEKRMTNLSDLLHFNSTVFHQYFTNITSFPSSNTSLLSILYLAELAFDAQILKMYSASSSAQNNEVLSMKELKQLWNETSKDKKIMTFQVATWITKYLQIPNKQELDDIIQDISQCSIIERKAFSLIEKWLEYRSNEDLRFFAYFAALQLAIQGSTMPVLIDIIDDMFLIDNEYRFKSLVEHVPQADIMHNNLTVFETVYYSARTRRLDDSKKSIINDVHFVLQRLGLQDMHNKLTKTLSGVKYKPMYHPVVWN